MSPKEREWIQERTFLSQSALRRFLDLPIDENTMPTIAIAASGGSYRAMFATLGLLDGLQTIGLLDAVSYMATVSGSTWCTMPWLVSNKPINQFYYDTLSIAEKGLWVPTKQTTQAFYQHMLRQNKHKKSIYSIDWYAHLLADKLLHFLAEKRYTYSLKDLCLDTNLQAKTPYPIALISASDETNAYSFVEWHTSQLYTSSRLVTPKEPVSLGKMLAIGGSSFCLSVRDLVDHAPDYIEVLEQFHLFHRTKEYLRRSPLANKKIFGVSLSPLGQVFDAGYVCNLPLQPLLNPERKVDIIIMLDNKQSPAHARRILDQAQELAKQEGLTCPNLDTPYAKTKNISVYKDNANPQAPTIVYLPLKKNIGYDQSFDPARALFCNTFNFTYSSKQAQRLAGLVAHTIREHKDLLKDEIMAKVQMHSKC